MLVNCGVGWVELRSNGQAERGGVGGDEEWEERRSGGKDYQRTGVGTGGLVGTGKIWEEDQRFSGLGELWDKRH